MSELTCITDTDGNPVYYFMAPPIKMKPVINERMTKTAKIKIDAEKFDTSKLTFGTQIKPTFKIVKKDKQLQLEMVECEIFDPSEPIKEVNEIEI